MLKGVLRVEGSGFWVIPFQINRLFPTDVLFLHKFYFMFANICICIFLKIIPWLMNMRLK